MAAVGTTSGVAGNVNEAMKAIFEEPMGENIVQDSELLDVFEQDMNVSVNETTGGRYIELAHYFYLPAGVGARRLEGDYIPVPDGPTIKNSTIYLKKVEGVVEMTGDTMRRVQKGEGAFLDWADRALPDLVRRVTHELDRMLLGYGSGIKARVAAGYTAGANTTITVDRSFGVTGYTDAFLQFMENERVVFSGTADSAALRSSGSGRSRKVLDVNPTTGAIVLDEAVDAAVVAGDYIFAGDNAGHSGQGGGDDREIMGLLGMVDDGSILASFQGLTRSSYRPWNAVTIDAATAESNAFAGHIDEELLTYADDQCYVLGGGRPDTIVTSRLQARKYWRSLAKDKTLNDPRSFTGGVAGEGQGKGRYSGLSILLGDREVALKVSRKLPPEILFGVQSDTLKRWQNVGWEWDDTTGSIWNRVSDATGRKDQFYAVGHIVLQTGCIAPRKNFVIRGLSRARAA